MHLLDSAIDLSTAATSAATAITTQISAVLPIALTTAGSILAVVVGWKIFRRFVKA
jgi:hypothetical protein